MEMFKVALQVLNVLSALAVIILVLIQHGKGADMGAAFGSGSAGSLFGASGSANFMSRTTAVCATIFFCSLFGLVKIDSGLMVGNQNLGVMSKPGAGQAAPAIPDKKPDQPVIPD